MTDSNDGTANSNRKQGHRFQKGRSGNPAGRPAGSRNRATIALEKLMADDGPAVVNAVVAAAKDGDMGAARLVLERIAPVRKGRPVTLDLPPVRSAADVLVALAAVVEAMAGGEISPEEAATVAAVLETKRKAIETQELEARLAALEEAQTRREKQ